MNYEFSHISSREHFSASELQYLALEVMGPIDPFVMQY